ncbi:MAG: hypothetical protein PW790_11785 [Parvibaculaceae bacterium]|nr:hypothetical protein [Parvibaculaceae bacterium]
MKSFHWTLALLALAALTAARPLPASAGPSDHATLQNPGGGPPADLTPLVRGIQQRVMVPGNGWFSGDDLPSGQDNASLWRNAANPAYAAGDLFSLPGAGAFDGDKPTRACQDVVRDAVTPDGQPVLVGATQCFNASNQTYIVPGSEHIVTTN